MNSWINGATSRDGVLALLPDIGSAYESLCAALWQQPHLPGEVLELCRLRLAQLHGSEVELSRSEVALAAAQRDALADWHREDAITAAQKACLSFTEVYAMDAGAITDEHAEAVKVHFGDAGLVMLIEALGVFDGMVRLSLLWRLPLNGSREGKR